MAKNLLKAGFPLVVHSRSRGPVDDLVQTGAKAARSPREVAAQCDVLITVLPNSPDVELVVLGKDGVIEGVRPGLSYVDMSTISPIVSQKVGKALEPRGVRMLDAPVSGGEKGAIDGTLSVMVSDGSRLAQWERREMRQPAQPRGVPQIIRALNNARKNNRLYVRLLAPDAGAVVSGEQLSSLPPSVLGVIEADRSNGDFVPLRNATLGEWDVLTEYAVVGSRLLTINLDSN